MSHKQEVYDHEKNSIQLAMLGGRLRDVTRCYS
jgi:hypothetical protein